jgi:hypothetical protein
MLKQIQTNSKLASLGTIGLLFFAGIAGMVFLLPNQTAHAATPTVFLSTISSGVLTAATSGTPGSSIVITGSGFDAASSVTITTTVRAIAVPWLTVGICSTANGGSSGTDSLVSAGCLTTSAIGDFQVKVTIPNLPGGEQTISVSDGTNSANAVFTITPSVTITYTGDNFGFPEEAINPTIALVGFGSGESVTVATQMWTTLSFGCVTSTFGSCSESMATRVADTTGGSKTITATGTTSGLVATTTFTVNPWAAFYNFAFGETSYSFIGSAPTSVLVEAHGLAAGTIAANSITIGGVATSHAAVTVGSNGAFGGAGGQLVVSPTSSVPFGDVSVIIRGTTFSYANGNIALGPGVWGGALSASILGSTSSTGVLTTDKSSYMPGTGFTASTSSPAPAQNQVAFFGYGFVVAGGRISIGSGGSGLGTATYHGGAGTCSGTCDANGAVFAIATLGDTSWSFANTPTIAASYAATTVQAPSAPANILSPSFGITPWIQSPTSTKVDYTTSTETVTAHGFSNTELLSLEIGGSAMVSGGTCTTSTTGTCTTTAGQVPDLAGGIQSVTVAGALSGVSARGSVTYYPIANSASGQTLSITSGGAGQTTTIRTGNGYGVHGLMASTTYNIIWNAISDSIIVGSFASTATGGIPSPGVKFTIPSDSGGIHILDLRTSSGASAFFAGQLLGEYTPTEAPFSGTFTTAYGDMLFSTVGSASTTSVSCSPASLVAASTSTCTATVKGSSPTGTMTWTSSSVTGRFSSGGSCTLTSGSCSVAYTDTVSGSPVITATYGGDASNSGSSGSFGLTVTPRSSSTSLSCAKPFDKAVPITCTATVTDRSSGTPITPSGTVNFSASEAGSFSTTTCSLSGRGATATCTVTFTPAKTGLYKIVAGYTGDASHLGSSAHQSLIVKR